jgi:3',5'-cyclic AMP phosphodiesterase CpdA
VQSPSPSGRNVSEPVFRLAHISDMHFGKISHPDVVPAVVSELNEASLDAVVISGDLTQRARPSEFGPAKEMLEAIEHPIVVVPGNHDVPPWWRPVNRLLDAGGPFRHYISNDRTPTFTADRAESSLAIFGLDSSRGLSIAGGKIRSQHVDLMSEFFADQPEGTFRVLTVHHQLTQLKKIGPHDVARGAKSALRQAAECGVDLILCGHLHMSHVAHIEVDIEKGHRIVVASAGTATSSRGRLFDRNVNFYNQITIWTDRFAVEERRFDRAAQVFVPIRKTPFSRTIAASNEEQVAAVSRN